MVTWKDIHTICRQIDFPEDAVAYLEGCYGAIVQKSADKLQNTAVEWMRLDGDWRGCLGKIAEIAQETGVSLNSARMVFFLYCAIPLVEEYEKRGLPETLYWETLKDLRYKLLECRALYGEWGTFVPDWYRCFYTCGRFALGRLQYEPMSFPLTGYKNAFKQGDVVYSCHIPSSGALREEDVLESLKYAYRFYQAELKSGVLPVVCHSWLLYGPLETVFADSPNILKFRSLFDVVQNDADGNNGDFWRVFYQEFSKENLENAPTNTKMQQRLKKYLLDGNTMGCGWGILLFDGEKIING